MALDAIVLAGGGADAVSALEPGAPNKAFVRVGGVPLVARTIAGLRESSRIDRIVVVAPPAAAAHPALAGASEVRGDGPRMLESLRSGMQGFTEDALVVVVASDLPALDAPAVDEFVDAVLGARARRRVRLPRAELSRGSLPRVPAHLGENARRAILRWRGRRAARPGAAALEHLHGCVGKRA